MFDPMTTIFTDADRFHCALCPFVFYFTHFQIPKAKNEVNDSLSLLLLLTDFYTFSYLSTITAITIIIIILIFQCHTNYQLTTFLWPFSFCFLILKLILRVCA